LIEVVVGGLLSGVMYALVAIGFVLIYKTSGVLNFAQGAMVLLAALTFVSLTERGLPFPAALAATLAPMVTVGLAVGRAGLRPLVHQPPPPPPPRPPRPPPPGPRA
ncbi:ABC transporter permease subunit, partial [Methylobacterium radiotolerans]|uniref:ABC transporter permease subunit n=2 Tax=Methylobacterium radiotolerans TaxID=31998 RepID=UPI003F664E55